MARKKAATKKKPEANEAAEKLRLKVSRMEPITAGNSYSLPLFQQYTGLGPHAVRQANVAARHHKVTLVREAHGRSFVIGDDWLKYLRHLDGDEDESD